MIEAPEIEVELIVSSVFDVDVDVKVLINLVKLLLESADEIVVVINLILSMSASTASEIVEVVVVTAGDENDDEDVNGDCDDTVTGPSGCELTVDASRCSLISEVSGIHVLVVG